MTLMGPIDSSRRSRSSSDGQFWVLLMCVLPFSLSAWALVFWWAFEAVPTYATRLFNDTSNWIDADAGSIVTVVHRREGSGEEIIWRRAEPDVSRTASKESSGKTRGQP